MWGFAQPALLQVWAYQALYMDWVCVHTLSRDAGVSALAWGQPLARSAELIALATDESVQIHALRGAATTYTCGLSCCWQALSTRSLHGLNTPALQAEQIASFQREAVWRLQWDPLGLQLTGSDSSGQVRPQLDACSAWTMGLKAAVLQTIVWKANMLGEFVQLGSLQAGSLADSSGKQDKQ